MIENSLHLFDAVGIEMEYMLVDRETLDVRPVADQLLAELAGRAAVSDFTSGPITWSNELALHVIELKTTEPAAKIRSLPSQFEQAIGDLRPALDRLGVRLLPGGMHPWMDPRNETRLWPHENRLIYEAYDKIFDCRTHGWANVQSVHLNLPFGDEQEFARLHAAVRIVLPILPALSAGSPIVDGARTGASDSRMQHYVEHCRAVPSLIGRLVPEAIFDEATYRTEILETIGRDIRPLDPDGVLHPDFLNARGAIARFDRGSIELRVMDVQEYPGADVAICAAVVAVIKSMVAEQSCPLGRQQAMPTERLESILRATSSGAENAVIDDEDYLSLLGVGDDAVRDGGIRAGDVWSALLARIRRDDSALSSLYAPLQIIADQGTLATRICKSLGDDFTREDLHNVYDQLSDCLDLWEPFQP